MKSGNFATGSPEYGLLSIAGAEMARFYGIPSMMGGMGSSAKAPGIQLGFEKAITTFGPAIAGCDLLTGIGGLNDAAFVNMEEMLMDAQIWGDLKRTWQGIEVNDTEIALEVIEKVGPKGQYLNNPHTFANYRRLHLSRYSDRSSYMAWENSGKKDMFDVAHEEVKRLLETHKPVPLPRDVSNKLAEIEKRASQIL
jgi:trimethylamine--corrinoid protein Co-methyltransferase